MRLTTNISLDRSRAGLRLPPCEKVMDKQAKNPLCRGQAHSSRALSPRHVTVRMRHFRLSVADFAPGTKN